METVHYHIDESNDNYKPPSRHQMINFLKSLEISKITAWRFKIFR